MATNVPTILIIIGITGDLAQRKLLPALREIGVAKELPEQFQIVGVTRRADTKLKLPPHSHLFQMDVTDLKEYQRLATYLKRVEKRFGVPAQRLFYLSIPPQVSRPIIELLGKSGLAKVPRTKLLVEKPFGVDLASATELVDHIDHHFAPEQVYRIDHYLAKETAQNLIVFREHNSLFKRTWNKDFIERIEITASESIGIEGRATFYEQTGALRDIVQSHLLQLAALALMETPRSDKLDEVPARRLEALRHITVAQNSAGELAATRAQYRGYTQEVDNPGSTVETFVSLTLSSDHPRWQGVPITLTSGKALNQKLTQIKIHYKKEQGYEANELVIQLQPDEGVLVSVWAKRPGYDYQVNQHYLKFAFKEHYTNLPEAYEKVLFNAINSDHSLFTTSEEVLETWRILDPVQQKWEMETGVLTLYPRGSAITDLPLSSEFHPQL